MHYIIYERFGMKSYKYLFQLFVVVTVTWFSSMGCVTKDLWSSGGSTHGSYNDEIISFYLSPQKNTVVFISDDYHYIFEENTESFISFLQERDSLNLQKENLTIQPTLHLSQNNQTYVNIHVAFNGDMITVAQKKILEQHGFTKGYTPPHIGGDTRQSRNNFPNILHYMKNYTIKGRRYLANSEVNMVANRLKQPIFLKFHTYKDKGNVTAEKVLMTPLTVAADAGLILAGAIVVPLVWLFK